MSDTNRTMSGLALATLLAIACAGISSAYAENLEPLPACARADTNDTLRKLPPALLPAVRSVFGLSAASEHIERTTVWRCMDGKVLACSIGANLPCGKLDTRSALPAVTAWCRSHPDGPVPAFVSGHGSVWRWRCTGPVAAIAGAAWHPDERGFAAELWKPLP